MRIDRMVIHWLGKIKNILCPTSFITLSLKCAQLFTFTFFYFYAESTKKEQHKATGVKAAYKMMVNLTP